MEPLCPLFPHAPQPAATCVRVCPHELEQDGYRPEPKQEVRAGAQGLTFPTLQGQHATFKSETSEFHKRGGGCLRLVGTVQGQRPPHSAFESECPVTAPQTQGEEQLGEEPGGAKPPVLAQQGPGQGLRSPAASPSCGMRGSSCHGSLADVMTTRCWTHTSPHLPPGQRGPAWPCGLWCQAQPWSEAPVQWPAALPALAAHGLCRQESTCSTPEPCFCVGAELVK